MTKHNGKILVACTAMIMASFASTAAYAGDSFNKFPTHAQTPTYKTVQVTTRATPVPQSTRTHKKTRTIKRVVKPTQAVHAHTDCQDKPKLDRQFNKMTLQSERTVNTMPVFFDASMPAR